MAHSTVTRAERLEVMAAQRNEPLAERIDAAWEMINRDAFNGALPCIPIDIRDRTLRQHKCAGACVYGRVSLTIPWDESASWGALLHAMMHLSVLTRSTGAATSHTSHSAGGAAFARVINEIGPIYGLTGRAWTAPTSPIPRPGLLDRAERGDWPMSIPANRLLLGIMQQPFELKPTLIVDTAI